MIERYVTLACVSNEVGGDLIGNARWLGVPMKDLLDEARAADPGADQVVSRSVDGFTAGTPTAVLLDGRDAMIAVGMNGEPLPVEHGFPVRMVVPGLYGYVSATKWLAELELTTFADFDAYWVPRGWSAAGADQDRVADRHARAGTTSRRAEVVVAGVAWAQHRGISKVEVRVDDGAVAGGHAGRRGLGRHLAAVAWQWEATPGRAHAAGAGDRQRGRDPDRAGGPAGARRRDRLAHDRDGARVGLTTAEPRPAAGSGAGVSGVVGRARGSGSGGCPVRGVRPSRASRRTTSTRPRTPVAQVLPAGGEQAQPLGLGEAAPDAVRLAGGQRVGGALGPDRAGAADRLRRRLAAPARRAALAVGVEELGAVTATARAVALPVPDIRKRTRQPAYAWSFAHPPPAPAYLPRQADRKT